MKCHCEPACRQAGSVATKQSLSFDEIATLSRYGGIARNDKKIKLWI